MNKYRFLHWFSYIGLAIAYIFVFVVMFWLIYPYKVIEWKEPVFPLKNKIIKRGTNLVFIADYCKYMPVTAVTSRTFANDIYYITPESTTNRETGCHKVNVAVLVPSELPPGKYHLKNIYKYQVNPYRVITLEHNTEEFTVID